MAKRFRAEDVDRLLQLAQSSQVRESGGVALGGPATKNGSSMWQANQDFWLQCLRDETANSWTDDEYRDAALLLNVAEHQQVVFKEFVGALNTVSARVPNLIWANAAPSDSASVSSDQLQFRDSGGAAFESDDSSGATMEPWSATAVAEVNGNGGAREPAAAADRRDDASSANSVRTRDGSDQVFNSIRANLFVLTGLESLKPYHDWQDFQDRNDLPQSVVADLKAAYPDGFENLDLWVGELAEGASSAAGHLTLAEAIANEVQRLEDSYPFDGLSLLTGTGIALDFEDRSHSDIANRHSGSTYLKPLGPWTASESSTSLGVQIAGSDAADVLVGTAGADVIDGGGGDDILIGGGGNDTLSGGTGNDTIEGDAGDDTISGGAGDDTVDAGSGDDTVEGGAGDDVLVTRAGRDNISAGEGNDTIDAGSGDDVVDGGSGDDVVTAGEGDDTVETGSGDDVVDAGSGDDVIAGGAGDDTVSGGSGDDVVDGGAGDDIIEAGSGDDVVEGGSGEDVMSAGSGDDVLDGGEGADTMAGGEGDDTYVVDTPGDVVIEEVNGGTDTIETTASEIVLSDYVEILVYFGSEDFSAIGNALDNLISGGAGNDSLDGGAGTDTLAGGLGNDVYIVSEDGDVVLELDDAGIDTVETTRNSQVLAENVEILVFVGSGSFEGLGNALANIIEGGAASDVLSGAGGNDVVFGGAGDDVLSGGEGDDYLDGGQGNDNIEGGAGSDYICGDDGDDELAGGDGDNVFNGGQGNDSIVSQQANEFIMFTRGSDTIVLQPGFGNDVVIGFDADPNGYGGQDYIDVSAYGFTSDALGIDILMIYEGDGTTIHIGSDSIRIVLVDTDKLDKDDFIFS